MSLFEDIERTYDGPIAAGETHFAYLNRSARVEAARIRAFLEQCVAKYPAKHRTDIEARLRSGDRVHERRCSSFLCTK